LEKARALDSDHPAIGRVADSLAAPQPAASFSSGPSPSFVVDTPVPAAPAPGRGTAQAVDFGFTFEEDKTNEPSFDAFSFDAPSPAPAAPAAPEFGGFSFDAPSTRSSDGTFDFTPAPPPTGGDDQRKIEQYLADGDRAANAGNYQQAIDLWSRIFLIDVTNDEASSRIENAKAKRRENDAKVEALLAAGEKSFNAGEHKTARDQFEEALRLDPGNLVAHEFIERITAAAPAPFETPFSAPAKPSETPAPKRGDIFDDEEMLSGSYDSLKPPDPVVAPIPAKKAATATTVAPAKKRSASSGVLLTILAVMIIAAAGWFVWSKYMSKPSYDPAATQAIFVQANSLAKRQRYDQAIAVLGNVSPSDPQHDKALEMIADLQHKKAQAAQMVGGRPASIVYEENLAAGRTAFEAHDYETAKTALDAAARIKALPPDVAAMYTTASQQVSKLETAKALFKEHRYQDAVTNLDPLLQSDPQNQSIRRMLIAAHFDLGATALQEEKLHDAMREFDEVLKSDPNDELAKRSRTLAERYSGQPKDLLYKIYVKYLPLRG